MSKQKFAHFSYVVILSRLYKLHFVGQMFCWFPSLKSQCMWHSGGTAPVFVLGRYQGVSSRIYSNHRHCPNANSAYYYRILLVNTFWYLISLTMTLVIWWYYGDMRHRVIWVIFLCPGTSLAATDTSALWCIVVPPIFVGLPLTRHSNILDSPRKIISIFYME